MNITNIDDKIIKRARQNHLYETYLLENKRQFSKVVDDVNKAVRLFEVNYKAETDPDKQAMMATMVKLDLQNFKFLIF
jgi:cysteinyl-tRNA synthetase